MKLTDRQFSLLHDAAFHEEKRLQGRVNQASKRLEQARTKAWDAYQARLIVNKLLAGNYDVTWTYTSIIYGAMSKEQHSLEDRIETLKRRLNQAESRLAEYRATLDSFIQKQDLDMAVIKGNQAFVVRADGLADSLTGIENEATIRQLFHDESIGDDKLSEDHKKHDE